jgi:hypothetical protein
VRSIKLIACGTAALGAITLALGTASGAQRGPDSGIQGLVLYGPTCPVQRPGHTCVRTFQATITIKREPAGTVVVRLRSAADGRFTIRLEPGGYLLQPRNGRPFPRAKAQTVSVHSHAFTAVTIRYDSGIR